MCHRHADRIHVVKWWMMLRFANVYRNMRDRRRRVDADQNVSLVPIALVTEHVSIINVWTRVRVCVAMKQFVKLLATVRFVLARCLRLEIRLSNANNSQVRYFLLTCLYFYPYTVRKVYVYALRLSNTIERQHFLTLLLFISFADRSV